MLIKHDYICRNPTLCLTDQGKYVRDGVYDPVQDACFVLDEAYVNSYIVGNLNGGAKNDYGCTSCGRTHQFVYDACVDWSFAKGRG